MKFKKYIEKKYPNKSIEEKFLKGWKFSPTEFVGAKTFKEKPYVEFFVNPSKREMAEVSGEGRGGSESIRFIADAKAKKVYIWNPLLMHQVAWNKIGDKRDYVADYSLLAGIAEKRGASWVMTSASTKLVNPEEWEWVEKYIKVVDFLKTYKGPSFGF